MKKNRMTTSKLFCIISILLCAVCLFACKDTEHSEENPIGHTHDLTHNPEVAAACTALGIIEYWHCEDCGKNYSDMNAINEISDISIPALGHSFVNVDTKAPTCAEIGWETHKKCERCEQRQDYKELAAVSSHSWQGTRCSVCNIMRKASEGIVYELNYDGKSYAVSSFGTASGDVVIAEEYEGMPVTRISGKYLPTIDSSPSGSYSPAYPGNVESQNSSVISVAIPDSIEVIEENAFSGFTNLTSVSFGINSRLEILSVAFKNCTSLKSIVIPAKVRYIETNAFNGCQNLESVSFYDNSQLEYISQYAFNGCSKLTYFEMPSSIACLGSGAFSGCTSLLLNEYDNAYYLGNKDNPYLVLIAAKDKNITSCDIHEDVKLVYYSAFVLCNELQFNEYDNAYYLGNEENPYMVLMLAKDTTITSCVINEKTRIIYDVAFYSCSNLTDISIPSSVEYMGQATFVGCDSLNAVHISDMKSWMQIDFGSYAGNPLYCAHNLYLNGELVTDLKIPEGITKIKRYSFAYCTSIEHITIPKSVKSIGMVSFAGTGLKNVTFEEGCVLEYIDMAAFATCVDLESFTIPNGVKYILPETFYGCLKLKSVVIPESISAIYGGAFSSCFKLVEVYNLSSLNIIAGISLDGIGNVSYYALNVYTSLSKESKIDKTTHEGYTFYVDGEKIYLLEYTGSDTEIALPNDYNVSNYEIYKYAFYENDKLTSITIPNSITSIGDYAFYNCSKLKTIYYAGTYSEWYKIDISSNNSGIYSVKRYYYSELSPEDTEYLYWHYVDGVPAKW